MRVLFDHNTPWPLRGYLLEHAVDTAAEKGWSELSNGDLLDYAERDRYELIITADQNMRYQQNLGRRRISIMVLRSNRWPSIRARIEEIRAAIDEIRPGELKEVPV